MKFISSGLALDDCQNIAPPVPD